MSVTARSKAPLADLRVNGQPLWQSLQRFAEIGATARGGCNRQALTDDDRVGLIDMCRAEGLEVYDPDVSMISAGGGAVHCMCQALRRESVAV